MSKPTEPPPPKRPKFFWWLLAIILSFCFAVVSWLACLHVFGNPEIPRNYAILETIHRVPELKRYTDLDVPNSSTLSPEELYRKFLGLNATQVAGLNPLLLRNYLRNFETPILLNYIEGNYRVELVRLLTPDDIISPGFVVRARAMVQPDPFKPAVAYPVIIDYLFPTQEVSAHRNFIAGDTLVVRKSPNCAAILHVAHLEEDDSPLLCLTIVPLAYVPYKVGESQTFSIEVPERVNPGAKLPPFEQTQP